MKVRERERARERERESERRGSLHISNTQSKLTKKYNIYKSFVMWVTWVKGERERDKRERERERKGEREGERETDRETETERKRERELGRANERERERERFHSLTRAITRPSLPPLFHLGTVKDRLSHSIVHLVVDLTEPLRKLFL